MSMKEELATRDRIIERMDDEIDTLKTKLQDAEYELAHYRVAVAAMKWLWEQAQQQKPFQL